MMKKQILFFCFFGVCVSCVVASQCLSEVFTTTQDTASALFSAPLSHPNQTVQLWSSDPRHVLAAQLDPTQSYLYLIVSHHSSRQYFLEKYAIDGTQIQVRSLPTSFIISRNVPFCVSAQTFSIIINHQWSRYRLSDFKLLEDPLSLASSSTMHIACSSNFVFLSLYGKNQIWIADSDGHGFLMQTPLFVPSPGAIHYDSTTDRLLVSSGNPAIELFSFNIEPKTSNLIRYHELEQPIVSLTSELALLQNGSLVDLKMYHLLEGGLVDVILPLGFFLDQNGLFNRTGEWNNQGNIREIDMVFAFACISGIHKIFIIDDTLITEFRANHQTLYFVQTLELPRNSRILTISGICNEEFVWWVDSIGQLFSRDLTTNRDELRQTNVLPTDRIAVFNDIHWCKYSNCPVNVSKGAYIIHPLSIPLN